MGNLLENLLAWSREIAHPGWFIVGGLVVMAGFMFTWGVCSAMWKERVRKSREFTIINWVIIALSMAFAGYFVAMGLDDAQPVAWRIVSTLYCGCLLQIAYDNAKKLGFHFLRLVPSHTMIPPFYGVAWVCYNQDAAYCAPIPLNILFGMLRSVWICLKCGWIRMPMSPRDAYNQGRSDMAQDMDRKNGIDCSKNTHTMR